MSENSSSLAHQNAHESANENIPPSPKRWPLVVILVVSVLPIGLAYFVFFTGIGVPKTTVNAGVMLDKVMSLESVLSEADYQRISQDKKWRLLIPVSETCENDQACLDNLYTTRQVYLRLGEKTQRVERLALSLDKQKSHRFLNALKDEHPYLKVATVDKAAWQSVLKASNNIAADTVGEHRYFLVDQESNVMMYYTVKQHGNELLKDIKRALKYSIDYQ